MIALVPKYISAYLNLADILIIAGKTAEAEKNARYAIKLAESIANQAISKYLLAVTLKIQGKSTAELDAELKHLCAQEFEIDWSFDAFENWLEGADISEPIKDYVTEKTNLLKNHKK